MTITTFFSFIFWGRCQDVQVFSLELDVLGEMEGKQRLPSSAGYSMRAITVQGRMAWMVVVFKYCREDIHRLGVYKYQRSILKTCLGCDRLGMCEGSFLRHSWQKSPWRWLFPYSLLEWHSYAIWNKATHKFHYLSYRLTTWRRNPWFQTRLVILCLSLFSSTLFDSLSCLVGPSWPSLRYITAFQVQYQSLFADIAGIIAHLSPSLSILTDYLFYSIAVSLHKFQLISLPNT